MERHDTWEVKEEILKAIGKKRTWTQYYICKCKNCHKEREFNKYAFEKQINGKCKCQMPDHVEDITGNKYGRLSVIGFSHIGNFKNSQTSYWRCICECGNAIIKAKPQICRINRLVSCGCGRKQTNKEIFHTMYEKTEGCWNWKGKTNPGGYGKWNQRAASRRAYEYAFGAIPKGLQVCHTCDNRKCVNPDHLFLGTISENMKDKVRKNRQARGSKIGSSILTEEKVLEIRKMRLQNNDYETIAKHFGLKWDTVRRACKGPGWSHVPLFEETKSFKQIRRYAKGEQASSKLKEVDVIEIKKSLKTERTKDVAEKYNVAPSTICDIRQGRTWAHVQT
jgi:hypothetical protein